MKKVILMTIMMMGLGTTMMMAQKKAAQPSVTSAQSNNLPTSQSIDISDVPVIVMNGLNNTYKYEAIEKIEVSTYNNVDIYKFTLILENAESRVVYFTPAGIEL